MKHLFVRQIYFLKGNDVLKAFSTVLSLAFLCATVFLQTSLLPSHVANAYEGFNKDVDKNEDIYEGQSYSDCSNNKSSACDFRQRASDKAEPYQGGRNPQATYDNQNQTVTELYNAHDGYEDSNLKEMNGERMSTITALGVAINLGYIKAQCGGTLTGSWSLIGQAQCAAAGIVGAAQILQYVNSKRQSEKIEASIDYDLALANGLDRVGLTDIPEGQRIPPPGVSSGLPQNGLPLSTPQITPDTESFTLPPSGDYNNNFENGSVSDKWGKIISDGERTAKKIMGELRNKGFNFDPKTNKVTLPNGVSIEATKIFTPEGAKKMGLSPQEAKAFLASHRRASKAAEKAKDKMEAQLNKDIKALKKQRRKLAEQRRLAGTGHQRRGFVPYKDNWKAPDFSHLLNGLNVDQEQQKGTLNNEDAYFVLGRAEDNIFEMVHKRYQAKRELLTSGININEENLAKDPVFLQRKPHVATKRKTLPMQRPASHPVKSSSFLQETL